MLGKDNIERFMRKIDFEDDGIGLFEYDEAGDVVSYFNSGVAFSEVKEQVIKKNTINKKIEDIQNTKISLKDSVIQGSSKVDFDIIVRVGKIGYGTEIVMLTKHISYYSESGKVIEFLSFAAMKKALSKEAV